MATTDSQPAKSERKTWHHKGPVVFSPLFDWPPKLPEAFLYMTTRWVTLTRHVLFLLLAIGTVQYLLPEPARMAQLSWEWIVPLMLRNLCLMILVAGGLHYYFFIARAQGKSLKFDHREEMETGRKFNFGNQLHDNMFWSLASGTTVWSLYEIFYHWGVANGVVTVFAFTDQPLAFFAWLLLLPLILSSHFYLVHRLLHWPPLYRRYHIQHHRNIHIGPWSGMSMHPVEHIIYISSVLIHFVIPSHPVLFLLHLYTRCLGPAFSHAGFEKLLYKDRKVTEAADFHHQLHHKYFECNYGTVDAPWDRWFGSVHDGSDEATIRIRERRRNMYKNKRMADT